jgi:LAGLIDADG-like domain
MAYDMTTDELLEAVSRITPQWLAGFFDGEGCVVVSKQEKNSCHTFSVCITQSEPKVLALIALRFGFGVNQTKNLGRRCYTIRITGSKAVPFLTYIKDHVVCKRRQVEAALEFAKTMNVGSTEKLTITQIETRDRLAAIIKQANHGIDTLIPVSKEGVL